MPSHTFSVPVVIYRMQHRALYRRVRFIVAFIEFLSALAIMWQFIQGQPEKYEKITLKIVAVAFFALSLWVGTESVLQLINKKEALHSTRGLCVTALSLIVISGVYRIKIKTDKELGSLPIQENAQQLLLCIYLSVAVFIGLILNSLFAWWRADSVAGIIVVLRAIREGCETREKGAKSPMGVLDRAQGEEA